MYKQSIQSINQIQINSTYIGTQNKLYNVPYKLPKAPLVKETSYTHKIIFIINKVIHT
jgi:hypothetical protein